MSEPKYAHIVRAISETPWAILLETLEAIQSFVAFRAQGGVLTDDEIQARIGAGPARRASRVVGNVAVLPLYGVIFPRASLFTQMSGGTSLQEFAAAFDQAVADPDIGAILIDVASPGGSTSLVPETADRIRAARGTKPIAAIANTLAASAAYWLAAQADEIVAAPSSWTGSVGVYMAHEDWSRFDDMLGVTTTYISAGAFKTEGNPTEPLNDEAKAHLQGLVDDMYGQFVTGLAKGRATTASAVRAKYGQGRVFSAKQALEAGMVDRIDTFEATLAKLRAGGRPAPKGARAEDIRALDEPEQPTTPEPDELDIDDVENDPSEAFASLREIGSDIRQRNAESALARDLRDLTTAMRTPTEVTT